MYTEIEEAVHFIFSVFNGKKRIKEDISLAFHSISVAVMLLEEKCDYETILTGLLHDVLEDSATTYDDLKIKFGEKIASNVLLLSEKQEIIDFKERKQEFISRISESPQKIVLIEIADKLQNLLSDYELYKKDGKKALATLNTTYEMNKWYYFELLHLFENRISDSNLLNRYREIVNIYFND